MIRYILSLAIIAVTVAGSAYIFFPSYWIHRYDPLIDRHAPVYRLDPKLIWSVIYEESYFRPLERGAAEEVGLMQVTPLVARDWAKSTGLNEIERAAADNVVALLSDPETNIQVGCWYLEKLREQYRGSPAETAMALAAYNAGPSRVTEWTSGVEIATLAESDFVDRIAFSSTRAYVRNILERYRSEPKPK